VFITALGMADCACRTNTTENYCSRFLSVLQSLHVTYHISYDSNSNIESVHVAVNNHYTD